MKEEIEKLIKRYKFLISKLQEQSKMYESTGRAGMCISINGKIQTYNAVIFDLKRINLSLEKKGIDYNEIGTD